MSYTEKYRPQSLAECLYPDQATKDLIRDFAANAMDSSLVLYGPMGTGKSLMAKLIADELRERRAAWTETLQGTVLQTASKSDAAAETIERRSHLICPVDRWLFIIEEFDRIKLDSQMAFSYLMDKADMQLILTTNEVHDIDKRILSRAHVCHISGATQDDMLTLAQHVVASEGVTATQQELEKLTVSSAGNVRDLMRGLEGLVLRKRRQLVQTVGIQGAIPSSATTVQAQPVAGTPLLQSVMPPVSLIPPDTPTGQPTP